MQEMWVRPLGQEDPPGVRNGSQLQYSCLENSVDRGVWWAYRPWGCRESDRTEGLSMYTCLSYYYLAQPLLSLVWIVVITFNWSSGLCG